MARKAPPKRPADTIAAVATAPGRGGVGIIRLSGTGLASMAATLGGQLPRPRHATFAHFYDHQGQLLDSGLLLFFPAPHSFTGEDVIELQVHGGPVVLQLLLARSLELGARLARAGEFSERAFINGKMDLAQAEAVADLIEAETAAAARSAARSLQGVFSQAVTAICDALIEMRMLVEASLDFPEEEIDFLADARVTQRLIDLQTQLAQLFERASQGALLRGGMNIVLAGQPNVGKSSLLNALAGSDRAIVTAIAGTTRDTVRETIQLNGMAVHIIDTAGLRDSDDVVERIGVERSWREIEQANVILRIVDACNGPDDEDQRIDARLPADLPRILVFNKADLAAETPRRVDEAGAVQLYLSAHTGEGVALLREALLECVGWHGVDENVILARERHLVALRAAAAHLNQAQAQQHAPELLAEELRLAQKCLGEISGEFSADELLGEIFSRFCIGK